jgi:hypothetical protein
VLAAAGATQAEAHSLRCAAPELCSARFPRFSTHASLDKSSALGNGDLLAVDREGDVGAADGRGGEEARACVC